jgi:hypothetical protein
MKRVATRTTVIHVLCALALLLLALPAWSAPKVPIGEAFGPFFFPAGDVPGAVCDFPVSITGTSAQAARATLPSGQVVITGPAVATVTNLDTGESATYNISGPLLRDPETGGRLTLRGTNLIIGPLGSSGGDTKFLIFTAGTVSFIEGQPIEEPLRGTVIQDVCDELA